MQPARIEDCTRDSLSLQRLGKFGSAIGRNAHDIAMVGMPAGGGAGFRRSKRQTRLIEVLRGSTRSRQGTAFCKECIVVCGELPPCTSPSVKMLQLDAERDCLQRIESGVDADFAVDAGFGFPMDA